MEQPLYDRASVLVSSDDSSWTSVFENSAEITQTGWESVTIDISAVADGEATNQFCADVDRPAGGRPPGRGP